MQRKILITGGTGQVGRRLIRSLLDMHDDVFVVSRDLARVYQLFGNRVVGIHGDPTILGKWQDAVDGTDAVIHLAGENVATRRWTPSIKNAIRSSRVDSTVNVCDAIVRSRQKPRLISASAIGWYGETPDSGVDESSPCGTDYLAKVCSDWESSSSILLQNSVVRIIIRVGIVLERDCGALSEIARPIRYGFGGPLAGGQFFMSWIHCEDLCRLFLHALEVPVSNIFNGVSPLAVRNHQFISAIAMKLHRFAVFPVPYLALRILVGEFAHYLCSSQHVVPTNTLASRFSFNYPEINMALAQLLDNKSG
jgi:uncharacterized protein (TIGR01777 family)